MECLKGEWEEQGRKRNVEWGNKGEGGRTQTLLFESLMIDFWLLFLSAVHITCSYGVMHVEWLVSRFQIQLFVWLENDLKCEHVSIIDDLRDWA